MDMPIRPASFEVLDCSVGVYGTAVGAGCALMVDTFGIVCYQAAAEVAYDFKNLFIIVHGVLIVEGRIVEFHGVCEVAFLEFDNLAHQWMVEVMLESWIVGIEISHIVGVLLGVFLVIFDEFGENLLDVAGDNVVGDGVDRRVGIVVHRDYDGAFLHTCYVLDLT